MAWLKQFQRDPQNLVGPNLGKAPVRTIVLSGTILSFRCPFQTAMIPGFVGPGEFDIDQGLVDDVDRPQNAHVKLYSTGWDLHDRASWGTPYGGVTMHLNLTRDSEVKGREDSLIQPSQMKTWICEKMADSFGSWNDEIWENRDRYVVPITKEDNLWQYPKSPADIQVKTINDTLWHCYTVYTPGHPSDVHFEAAISHRHVVRISFSPSSYCGDYFSPEHNLQEAAAQLIESVMATVKLELSPEAQQQFDEVKA